MVFAALLSACRSGPNTVAETPKLPEGAKTYSPKQLTSSGSCERPQYSYDGASIFYTSSNRSGHLQRQAYQYFFATQRERRLTFQDGNVESIIPGFKVNEIIYASSTDEIKESSDFIRNSQKKAGTLTRGFFGEFLPRTEIYFSDINGDKITRATRSVGFDGDLSSRRNKNEFAFVSARNNSVDVYVMIDGGPHRVTNTPKEIEFSPALSEKGELAFVRGLPFEPEPTVTPAPEVVLTSQIYVVDNILAKARALTSEAATVHLSPQWHPKAPWLMFTMNYPDPKNYEIYWIRKDGKCLERLTYTAEDEITPTFSPDGTAIVYSRQVDGNHQLFMIENLPPPVCVETTPSPAPSPTN
jgi:Tol biopolymer transport system component